MDQLRTIDAGKTINDYEKLVKYLLPAERPISCATCYVLWNKKTQESYTFTWIGDRKIMRIYTGGLVLVPEGPIPQPLLIRLRPFQSKIARDFLLTNDFEARELLRELSRLDR